MRPLLIILGILVVLILVVPFVSLGPGGKPLLEFADLNEPQIIKRKLTSLYQQRTPLSAAIKHYKWQDKSGQWHYSNEPPPKGVKFEVVEVDPDVNVTPAVETEDE